MFFVYCLPSIRVTIPLPTVTRFQKHGRRVASGFTPPEIFHASPVNRILAETFSLFSRRSDIAVYQITDYRFHNVFSVCFPSPHPSPSSVKGDARGIKVTSVRTPKIQSPHRLRDALRNNTLRAQRTAKHPSNPRLSFHQPHHLSRT
jgi:hypothetical protein